ncbi:hypothetical protein E2C01_029830 [Portunus trituberculatus]|uniref:Uncharacterized protein n=1 Tax=Portunus trituberculatus TaxID=210409 RepID=A0A5B7ETZ3_PORTR|nr:hypothetical protein [Portunus trituberculatus]
MTSGDGAYNEQQRSTDPNLTQNTRAPKHITAPPRPNSSPANYSKSPHLANLSFAKFTFSGRVATDHRVHTWRFEFKLGRKANHAAPRRRQTSL